MADRRILKYPLDQTYTQVVELPTTWRPIKFANQSGTPTIWAEADQSSEPIQRVITLAFTGEDVPAGRYVGTAAFGATGEIIIHCYVNSG
jgi:hypothetical protein